MTCRLYKADATIYDVNVISSRVSRGEVMDGGGERESEPASENIRTRRKHAKQQKKLEKKKKKEEEFLRDLRKPKDTKVVLADRGFLERLAKERVSKSSAGSFEFSTSDFPELSRKPEKTTTHKTGGNAVPCPVRGSSDVADTGSIGKGAKPEAKPPASGVVVNLGDLIVTKESKKGKKRVVTSGAKMRRMLESNMLCGNMLDSSNPKRSRGKHRETEKRTFTKLKLAIIRDRILSLKGRESKSWVKDMDRENFKLELDMYLSDLMKKLKVAKEERAAKATKTAAAGEVTAEDETVAPAKKGKGKKNTKYRKYCDNAHSEDLDKAVNALVQGIVFLQDRAYGRNPIKGKAKPRHVVGLREVKKCLMLHKVKMLIIAPDLEAQDTVFNMIEELKKCAEAQNIPCVFALSRRHLGCATKKSVPVSALGILYYDGLEEKFAAVKEKLEEAKDKLKTSSQPPSEVANIPQ